MEKVAGTKGKIAQTQKTIPGHIESLHQNTEGKNILTGRETLSDPRTLRQLGIFSPNEKLLSTLRKLNIGTHLPYYSPLSLNGVRVHGLDLGGSAWPVVPGSIRWKIGYYLFPFRFSSQEISRNAAGFKAGNW